MENNRNHNQFLVCVHMGQRLALSVLLCQELPFKHFFIYYLYVYECFACMFICVPESVIKSHKRAPDPDGTGVTVVRHHMGPGNWTQVFQKKQSVVLTAKPSLYNCEKFLGKNHKQSWAQWYTTVIPALRGRGGGHKSKVSLGSPKWN